ncbi:NUDIX domain-containing protein [Camelliibacillus cellulosilyticus]|uniref:NUDIX domain-containing protein n=1 Tax=Camelliibacillus cellulosilyticus TaxID=2174486 RepID=A0ABV9GMS3_9BACL
MMNLAAGAIICHDEKILLVKADHWSLPKGGSEPDESLQETAIREVKEETGFDVKLKGLAYATEFRKFEWGHYLQFYFDAEVVGGCLLSCDPDDDVTDVQYVRTEDLEKYLKFRPQIIPLRKWLKTKEAGHYFFDLDHEGIEL